MASTEKTSKGFPSRIHLNKVQLPRTKSRCYLRQTFFQNKCATTNVDLAFHYIRLLILGISKSHANVIITSSYCLVSHLLVLQQICIRFLQEYTQSHIHSDAPPTLSLSLCFTQLTMHKNDVDQAPRLGFRFGNTRRIIPGHALSRLLRSPTWGLRESKQSKRPVLN
jgi:hypothetical protein